MFYVSVVVIRSQCVDDSYLFGGETQEEFTKLAEKKFISLLEKEFGRHLTDDEKAMYLDDGYGETPNGSVCITWPDVLISERKWE